MDNDPFKYDVLIVGAGPAGLSTALHLAQLAPELVPRTLVLEKARHPRHKLCGGGLLPDAEVILENLGLDLRRVPQVEVDWARFDYDRRGFRMRPDPRRAFAFRVIRRHEFDAWLAEETKKRGVEIREGVTVKSVMPGGEDVTVEAEAGTFRAQVVVGADGSKGVVRRAVVPRGTTHRPPAGDRHRAAAGALLPPPGRFVFRFRLRPTGHPGVFLGFSRPGRRKAGARARHL